MMRLFKNDQDKWILIVADEDSENYFLHIPHYAYVEALPRYINYLYPLFERAKNQSEFEFIHSLLRVKGIGDLIYDPFETTKSAIRGITQIHHQTDDFYTARHLQLWIYCHILEASEPYEILYNLLDILNGGRFRIDCFPSHPNGRPQSPSEKISAIENLSDTAGLPELSTPLSECWDRNLRNSIFHADYALVGGDVYITYKDRSYPNWKLSRRYKHDELMTKINRAIAYFAALEFLTNFYISGYNEPQLIDIHPGFSNDRQEKAIVIVRQGYGLAGLKDNWTIEEIRRGKIPFRIGIFTKDEIALLNADHTLAVLPERNQS